MQPGTRRERFYSPIIVLLLLLCLIDRTVAIQERVDNTKCPAATGVRYFHISEFLGPWFIVQYYANTQGALTYRCMRAEFLLSPESTEITMNFTYSFINDPINEQLVGNITWKIPSLESPAHWVHAENPYESVYNTHVLDSDYKSWALLMHCAEQSNGPRYLSCFIMSRKRDLGINVIAYLRNKLTRYDIEVEYMFPMDQDECNNTETSRMQLLLPPSIIFNRNNMTRKHPLKNKHRRI